jgi:hypothetical protein
MHGPRCVVDSSGCCCPTDSTLLARFLHGQGFSCGRRCPLQYPWPQQVFSNDDVLPWGLLNSNRPLHLTGKWTGCLAQCSLRRPLSLEFALIWASFSIQQFPPVLAFCWAPSLCCTTFALATWCQCVGAFALFSMASRLGGGISSATSPPRVASHVS